MRTGERNRSLTKVTARLRDAKFSLRSLLLFMILAAISIGAWRGLREESYASADEICAALAQGELDFVNRHVRYGRFVRVDCDLEFHYIAEQGIKRIVHWGNAEARYDEIRNAQIGMYLGTSELSDPKHEEGRLAGVEHDHPRIYDVVFQTNRKNGKVAIMDGGSNVFRYTDKADEQ